MANVDITFIGLNETIGKFAKMDTKLYSELVKATDKSLIVLLQRAQRYPPARPSSKYRRTHTLGRRWEAKTHTPKSGPWGEASNKTSYGKWVMGQDSQANVHRGRWARTDQIAEEMNQKIVRFYEYAVEQGIK